MGCIRRWPDRLAGQITRRDAPKIRGGTVSYNQLMITLGILLVTIHRYQGRCAAITTPQALARFSEDSRRGLAVVGGGCFGEPVEHGRHAWIFLWRPLARPAGRP